ncbi:MAG: DUF6507 family protein [Micrococcales bacterium]|nr:DUF6507 family protein [Micrococcales bacterium]MCL2668964.1 DUF6507 family protein [Micrococcales bacterium]
MSGWKLDPAGIQAVLSSVNDEAAGLGEDLSGTPDAPVNRGELVLAGLRSEAVLLAPVINAVFATLESQSASVTSISNRINAGMFGVLNATIAYNRGNQEMAAEFQTAAASAAQTGDFSYFEQHGVQ